MEIKRVDENNDSQRHPVKIFISYSHEPPEEAKIVHALADLLKEYGVQVSIDKDASGRLIKWIKSSINQADFVLIIFTKSYQRRATYDGEGEEGCGVYYEFTLIEGQTFKNKNWGNRFLPILLNRNDRKFILEPLDTALYYRLDKKEHAEKLYCKLASYHSTEGTDLTAINSEAKEFANRLSKSIKRIRKKASKKIKKNPKDLILNDFQEKSKNVYDFDGVKPFKTTIYSEFYRLRHRDTGENHVLKILDINRILEKINIQGKMEEFKWIKDRFKEKVEFFKKFRDHPGIHDYVAHGYIRYESDGIQLDIPYMLSRYIEGNTLEKLLKDKKDGLPPEQIFNISEKILQAIVSIHKENLYYWIVSPEYILIRDSDNFPVFMYADLPEDLSMATDHTGKLRFDREFVSMLTHFKYKKNSPKEREIASVNATFGLLLYEMVTGDKEIRSGDFIENLVGKLNDTNSQIEPNNTPLVHGAMKIIAKSLETYPGKRYKNVNNLLGALKNLKKNCLKEN